MQKHNRFVIAIVIVLSAATATAAGLLPQVFSCGREGSAGGLGAGVDLTRYTVDVAQYPEAVCNDGSPAVFYYGSYSKPEDRDHWIIFLQGGGGCSSGQLCAERWCSIDSNYGLDKMSTTLTKPQIRGAGFMNPDPANAFGSWNRVLIYYCSSDAWSGTSTRTVQAALNGGATRDYDINFKGTRIIDAVLDTLRNMSPSSGRRRGVRHSIVVADGTVTPWPDLDSATSVMFAGSSAGGAGVRANLDRVGTKLRATNPSLDFRGVIDAIYATLGENRNFAGSVYCAADPRGCSYDSYIQATRQEVDIALWGSLDEQSCIQWHSTHLPGTEWRCSDGEHVNLNHLSTPFFIRQDLQDTNIGGDWVGAGYGNAVDYAHTVESELRNLQSPEEPRGATPGLFVPQCTDHESFTNNERVFDVKVNGLSFYQTVLNWWNHVQPDQEIRSFTGTIGRAPECP